MKATEAQKQWIAKSDCVWNCSKANDECRDDKYRIVTQVGNKVKLEINLPVDVPNEV